ncbi:TetR/AcrR family transcriptional regulator [Butyrivibrio sp. VCB2006]|uniref:TetR/AcrR family transcriptional regulator n=1 Tax=Butyrivibrio sp. VCB2006 TaxID=1280679 RepID=UPI0004261AB6|nr:TetR/AcrR family transcriptional regulator [Butyrivibrio sp. VCB2006]
MPKIIDNLKEQIQIEAMHQILTNGYSKTTIRSVANGCNIAVGTLYNYFGSKDELIISFMLEDWRECEQMMVEIKSADPEELLQQVHNALNKFIRKYESVFKDEDAQRVFADVLAKKHVQFRARIAKIIEKAVEKSRYEDKEFLSLHISDSIIGWTMADIPFDKQYSIIKLLV